MPFARCRRGASALRKGPFRLLHLLVPPLSLSFFLGPSLSAQESTNWAFSTTLGYGGAGTAVGYFVGRLAVQEATRDGRQAEFETPGAVMTAILGAWFGGRLGLSIGLEADSLLAEDKPLEPGHRRGVQLGTVLAGATLTSALGLLHATTLEDGKSRMVAAHALVGAALGAVVQWIGNDRLYPSGAAWESNVSVCRDGRIRLGVQLPFHGVGPGVRF